MKDIEDRTIVISGASSGIGAALARRLALLPGVRLGLLGRDAGRLGSIADACQARGALVTTAAVDTRDRDGLDAWLRDYDAGQPVDCVIANAAISAGALDGGHPERGRQFDDVFDVNVCGTLNLVLPLLPAMQTRRRGRIVLVSSLAAFASLPDAPAYSASKAALLVFGRALRLQLRPQGIKVNVVCPGFVTTPMSASFRGWKPLEITADDAARRIGLGLARDLGTIAFPWPLALVSRLAPLVPEPLMVHAMRLFHL